MGILAEIRDNKKQCRKCLEWLDTLSFGTFLDKKKSKDWVAPKRYLNSRCKKCASLASRQWSQDNKQYAYEKWVILKNNYLHQIHQGYGNKCSCCGETNPLFLTIDHVNNDGYKIRPRNKAGYHASTHFSGHYYKRIIKENFPGYLQLLCWNCNCGKARNKGICPHKNKQ